MKFIEKEQSRIKIAISNYENKKTKNNTVKNELALLDDEDIAYKFIGPIIFIKYILSLISYLFSFGIPDTSN